MAVDASAMRSALAQDAGFIKRLQALFCTIGVQILGETSGAKLATRQAYAKKVLNNPQASATSAAYYILQTDNFVGATIEIRPEGSGFAVMCSTADADALSQIATKWDDLAALFG